MDPHRPVLNTAPMFVQKSTVLPVVDVVHATELNGWSVSSFHVALGTDFGHIVDAWAQKVMVPRQFMYMTFWDDIGFITDDDVVVDCRHLDCSNVLNLRCGPTRLANRHYKVLRELTRKHGHKIFSFPPVPAFR